MKNKFVLLLLCLLIPLIVGFLSGMATAESITSWYAGLNKPFFNPPNFLFGPVWTLLYLMMAVAAWLVWRKGGWRAQRGPLTLYLVQLALNALWTPVFFGLRQLGLALVVIVLLGAAIVLTGRAFRPVSRLASGLLVPYLVWVVFAAALNIAIWRLN